VNNRFIKFLLIFLTFAGCVSAQVEVNGSLSFEIGSAGKASTFQTNETVRDYRRPHLGIQQFNLFLFSDLGNSFFFNGRLQWDTWGSGKLNQPRLTLAALNWEPANSPFSLTIGRFISPFGLYPRRQLPDQNLFVNAPLAYGYFINISDTHGLWPKAGDMGSYGTDDVGLTTIYFGGYASGAMFNWVMVPDRIDLTLGLSNQALSSQQNYTNLKTFNLLARLGLQPVIFWQQGFSFSYGSFMQRHEINTEFDQLEKYRQLLIGTDFILAYAYFELSGEWIYSGWFVPARDAIGFQVDEDGKLYNYELTNQSGYVDLKFEPPFISGAYLALRAENLTFSKTDIPEGSSLESPKYWDDDVARYSISAGYKINQNIIFRVAFSDQFYTRSGIKQKDDWTARSIIQISM